MAVAPSSFLKMIFCTYCGKSFGRHEHLERHLLTHTDIKPFSCLNCHRSFTRRDLLNRHYRAIHGVGENVTTTEETPRTSIACENCAKHKTKCDQQTPCGRCASKGWTCQPRARARRKKRIVDTDPKDQANDGTNEQEKPRQDSGYCSPNDTSKSIQDLPSQRQNSTSSAGSSSFTSPKTPAMTKSQDAWLLSPALPSQAAATAFMGFNMDDYFDPSCMPQTYEPWNMATNFVDEDPLAYMDLLNDLPIMQQPDFGFDLPLMDTTVPIATDINMIMDIGASEGDSKTTQSPAPAASMLPAPRNSQQNLLYLKQCLQNPELWNSCSLPIGDDSNVECKLVVSSLQRSTVEKLTAVTRDILSKTFAGSQSQQSAPGFLFSPAVMDGMVQLPPTPIIEYMLRMYANSLSRHYPIASRQVLDVNQIVSSSSGTGSLLALIMVAAGAANIPYHEAQDFAHGMLEACRPSLLEIGERETQRAHDLTLPHAVKLFILQAAWSGDKWQMGTAVGLRAAYTSMLSAQCPETMQSASDSSQKLDWRTWLQQEQISRLTYSWVLVDQEIALLNDLAPSCAIADLSLPMPDSDDIWTAKTMNDWSSELEKEYGTASGNATPQQQSLSTLFRDFLGQGTLLSTPLTPLSLRLLLQPLQAQVHYYRQLLDCFADSTTPQGRQAMTVATTRVQFNEVRALCQQWVWLAERYLEKNEMCSILQSSFIIFHLIGLNTVTSFQEIERLAKRHNKYGSVSNDELRRVLPRAIEAREEAIAHCGQILRIIRSIPVDERPPWWAAAIYRVGLVLWTDCLRTRESIASTELGRTAFPVDALPPNSPAIIKYLQTHEGAPCLTNRDGSWKEINNATAALQHCIDFCSGDYRSRFTEGESEKLAVLRNHCFVQSKPL